MFKIPKLVINKNPTVEGNKVEFLILSRFNLNTHFLPSNEILGISQRE